jgi:hypothetical protein
MRSNREDFQRMRELFRWNREFLLGISEPGLSPAATE